MLMETFTIFNGITLRDEIKLKSLGFRTWDDLLKNDEISKNKKLVREIKKAKKKYKKSDVKYFLKRIPKNERWKILGDFHDKMCFLDIETTGLENKTLTVLGICDYEKHYRVFVNGINFKIGEILKILKNCKIIVTFYGTKFDIPFLSENYKRIGKRLEKIYHVDLYYLSREVGLSGSLKSIEKAIGVEREEEIKDLSGLDAVKLWEKYKNGDLSSLMKLIRYNRSDTLNLVEIVKYIYNVKRSEKY